MGVGVSPTLVWPMVTLGVPARTSEWESHSRVYGRARHVPCVCVCVYMYVRAYVVDVWSCSVVVIMDDYRDYGSRRQNLCLLCFASLI